MSDGVGSVLTIIVFLFIIGLPVIFAKKSADKGVSKDEALLLCAHCKLEIPATARACPYCRRSASFDVSSKKGKELYYKIKPHRFWRAYIWGLVTELIFVPLVVILVMELF